MLEHVPKTQGRDILRGEYHGKWHFTMCILVPSDLASVSKDVLDSVKAMLISAKAEREAFYWVAMCVHTTYLFIAACFLLYILFREDEFQRLLRRIYSKNAPRSPINDLAAVLLDEELKAAEDKAK